MLWLTSSRIISKTSSIDNHQLNERFTEQETQLSTLHTRLNQNLSELQGLPSSSIFEEGTTASATAASEDHQWSIQSISRLLRVCQDSMSAISEARPTKLTFGDSIAHNSRTFEGVAGKAQGNVTRVHGNTLATGGSLAVKGQMDAESMRILFGTR